MAELFGLWMLRSRACISHAAPESLPQTGSLAPALLGEKCCMVIADRNLDDNHISPPLVYRKQRLELQ